MTSNEQARAEIQCFLEALDSYAERFATDPKITFAEHFCSMVPSVKMESHQT